MKQKTIRLFITIAAAVAAVTAVYAVLKLTGALDKIQTPEDLKELILRGGVFSYAVYFLIQFMQVTVIPIPAIIVTVAGTLVFGPPVTIIISIAAQMLGAVVAFYLGRKLGRRVAVWIAGEEQTKKWETQLSKGKYVFFLMMLFPLFPDDILCLIAGLTDMSFKFFVVANLITRPIAIVSTCYLGSGRLIPFHGYWLILWAVLLAAVGALLVLSFVYQEKIENFVVRLGEKLKRNKTKEKK